MTFCHKLLARCCEPRVRHAVCLLFEKKRPPWEAVYHLTAWTHSSGCRETPVPGRKHTNIPIWGHLQTQSENRRAMPHTERKVTGSNSPVPGSEKTPEQAKALPAKPGNLSSRPRTHVIVGNCSRDSHRLSSDLYVHAVAYAHTCMRTYSHSCKHMHNK